MQDDLRASMISITKRTIHDELYRTFLNTWNL